jgi:hypothetical protein
MWMAIDDRRQTVDVPSAAADKLNARGIIFTIISSLLAHRGLRTLLEPLEVTTPIGWVNGGPIARPDRSVITAVVLPSQGARSKLLLSRSMRSATCRTIF